MNKKISLKVNGRDLITDILQQDGEVMVAIGDGDDAHVHRRARGNRDGRAHVNGYARLREYVRVSGDALRL